MSLKLKVLLAALATLGVFACAQNYENHAPVCTYGQTLAYTNAGYSCNFISLVPPGLSTSSLTAQTVGPGAVLTPPVQSCGGIPTQTLIDWMGTWLCYNTAELYPSGGNSPQSLTPPSGQGGEFCTSAGMAGGAYPYGYSPYGVNPATMANVVVACSPGFQCQVNPGTTNSSTAYGAYGLGFGVGTPGVCVYTGYQGTI